MSLPGSVTTAVRARPTDFGAPFSPVAIAGIAAGAATGAGLLLVGFAFLLAYVTLGKEVPEEDNTLGIIGSPDAAPAAYEPLGTRNASSTNGSTNDLLRQGGPSVKGAEISTPMNLDLVGFTPEPYEKVSARTPRGTRAQQQQQQQDQAGYFANPPYTKPREAPTPRQGQGSFYAEAPYNRPREARSGQDQGGAAMDAMVMKEPQRGTIQSQTSYYSDASDPPYARLRDQGASRFEFNDDPPNRDVAAQRRENAIARKQEANYYSDGRYRGRAAYDR